MIKAIAYTAVIAAAVFLLSEKANAQKVDHSFGVHIASVHSNCCMESGRHWNNSNAGVYLRSDRWVVGGFYNSLYKPSMYVAYVYPLTSYLDLTTGLVGGYNRYPVVPLLSPSFHWPLFQGVEGRLSLMPGVGKGSAHALHLSIEYKL